MKTSQPSIPRPLLCGATVLLLLLLPTVAAADQAMNCIVNNTGGANPLAWVLPANSSSWVDLASMTLTAHEDSDVLVSAMVGFAEDNVPGSKIVYRLLVDGSVASRALVRRMPPNFPHSQMTVGYLSNVPAGDVVTKLQAKNLSSNDIYFFNFNLSAIYLDDANDTDESFSASDTSFTGWTTLGTTSVFVPAGDIVYLGATTRISAGTAGSDLELRFVDTTPNPDKVIYTYDNATPDVMTDGMMLARFYDPDTVSAGTRTFAFQVRNVSGLSTTARSPFFFAQVMPKYQLWTSDPTVAPQSVTLDGAYHMVVKTQEESPAAASRGDSLGNNSYRSYTFDVASFTPEAVASGSEEPLRWRLQLVKDGSDVGFDNGIVWGHAENDLQLGNSVSGGCGFCGWKSTSDYRMELRAQDICGQSGSSATIDIPSASVQAVFIPNFLWFSTSQCGGLNWKQCCNQSANCTYDCQGPNLSSEQHDRFTCP